MRSILFPALFVTCSVFAQDIGFNAKILTRKSSAQQYALYLPKDFQAQSKYPLLIFFDPGGDPTRPIQEYAVLADKYHFILAASYGCKNGPIDPSIDAAYAMIEDLYERFQLEKKILLCGFSGGARLATHLAIDNPLFSGVIACGATFPFGKSIPQVRKLPYSIVVGELDMNYLEAVKTSEYLDKIQNANIRVEHHEGHRWPAFNFLEDAFVWQLYQNKFPVTANSNIAYKRDLLKLDSLIKASSWTKSKNLLDRIKSQYQGYLEIDRIDSIENGLNSNRDYKNAITEWNKLIKFEDTRGQAFYDLYRKANSSLRPDTVFVKNQWTSFASEYNKLRNHKEAERRLVGERLFLGSWGLCAEQSYQSYEGQYYEKALLNAQIWAVFKPDDFDPWLMQAQAFSKLNNKPKAIESLKKAIASGLAPGEIANNEAFQNLSGDAAFQALIK